MDSRKGGGTGRSYGRGMGARRPRSAARTGRKIGTTSRKLCHGTAAGSGDDQELSGGSPGFQVLVCPGRLLEPVPAADQDVDRAVRDPTEHLLSPLQQL